MATIHKNLSEYNPEEVPSANNMKFAIIVAEWNKEITFNLAEGAKNVLIENGADPINISTHAVPGTFELPLGAKLVLDSIKDVDAIICCGCVIQGETKHFDFVCDGVTQGVTQLNLEYGKPVIFCVLTDNNIDQSRARSGGIHGNKGVEAGIAAIKMVNLKKELF